MLTSPSAVTAAAGLSTVPAVSLYRAATRAAPCAAEAVTADRKSSSWVMFHHHRGLCTALSPSGGSVRQLRTATTAVSAPLGLPPPSLPSQRTVTVLTESKTPLIVAPPCSADTVVVMEEIAIAVAVTAGDAGMGVPRHGSSLSATASGTDDVMVDGTGISSIGSIIGSNSAGSLDKQGSPFTANGDPVVEATVGIRDDGEAPANVNGRVWNGTWQPRVENLDRGQGRRSGGRGRGGVAGRGGGRGNQPGRVGGQRAVDAAIAVGGGIGGGGGGGSNDSEFSRGNVGTRSGRGRAAPPQLFEELQAMRRQVAELTALVSEQQRRDLEQRHQLATLLQAVLKGGVPSTVTDTLPGAVAAAAIPREDDVFFAAAGRGSGGADNTHAVAVSSATNSPPPSPSAAVVVAATTLTASAAGDWKTDPEAVQKAASAGPASTAATDLSCIDKDGASEAAVALSGTAHSGGVWEEAQLSVATQLQPELLALMEQEISARAGSSNVSRVMPYSSADKAMNANGSIVSAIGSSSSAAVEACVGLGANLAASVPVTLTADGREATLSHGLDDIQRELRHLLELELQTVMTTSDGGEATARQHSEGSASSPSLAAATTATVTAAADVALERAAPAANVVPERAAPAVDVLRPSAVDLPAAVIARPSSAKPLGPSVGLSLDAAVHPGRMCADDTAATPRTETNKPPDDTPSASTATETISASSGSSDGSSSSATAADHVFADESELRSLVAQLLSVSSETARLAREAKEAGVPLPPGLQQPAALTSALTLLQRFRMAADGKQAMMELVASPTTTATSPDASSPVASPPGVTAAALPESSAAWMPEPSGSSSSSSSSNVGGLQPRRSVGRGVRGRGVQGSGALVVTRGIRGAWGTRKETAGDQWTASAPSAPAAATLAASPPAAAAELTAEELAALRAPPAHMFQGLRRLSWEGEEPLVTLSPAAQGQAPAPGLALPAPPLLQPPPRAARAAS